MSDLYTEETLIDIMRETIKERNIVDMYSDEEVCDLYFDASSLSNRFPEILSVCLTHEIDGDVYGAIEFVDDSLDDLIIDNLPEDIRNFAVAYTEFRAKEEEGMKEHA